jgi:flavin-binding protein dodecin
VLRHLPDVRRRRGNWRHDHADRDDRAAEVASCFAAAGLRSCAASERKEREMADVAKVITIIGSSPESFAKAADAAVREAAKTLRGISGADVVTMSAVVENDRITEYRTTVNIAFAIER